MNEEARVASRYAYTGDQRVNYSHYLDVSKPDAVTTLVPEPGKVYEIRQTEGHHEVNADGQFEPRELPMPPDGNWAETSDPTWAEVEAEEAAKAEGSGEPADTPAPHADPPADPAPGAGDSTPAPRAKKKES